MTRVLEIKTDMYLMKIVNNSLTSENASQKCIENSYSHSEQLRRGFGEAQVSHTI